MLPVRPRPTGLPAGGGTLRLTIHNICVICVNSTRRCKEWGGKGGRVLWFVAVAGGGGGMALDGSRNLERKCEQMQNSLQDA